MDCRQGCCRGLLAKTLLVHIITHMKVKLRGEDFWKALLVWKLGYLSCTQLHVVEEACLGSLTMTSNTSVWPSTARNNPYIWLLLSMQAYRELFLCSFWTLATTSSLRWGRGRSFLHTVCTYLPCTTTCSVCGGRGLKLKLILSCISHSTCCIAELH